MDLNVTEIDNLDGECEDVGFIDGDGTFTPAAVPVSNTTSRVPIPRITTMAHKNRGSLAPIVHKPEPAPARKVTYDDILSSLNMKVVDGKLQIVRNVSAENVKSNNFNPQQQQQKQRYQQPYHQEQKQQSKFIPMQQQQQFSSNQSKQFQSMHQPMQQEMQPPPTILTREQYRRIQIANYLKEVQRIQHIRNAKSTKLKFSNADTNINISPLTSNTNDLNKFFMLKGVGQR